ncbi:MAG: S8 family serine peptidase, partial [Acidobacteriota bacterium]
ELSPEFNRQWGLDAARFRSAHLITRGRGVNIAVLDSGIDVEHPVFKDTLWGNHYNFVGRDSFPWETSGPPMVDWGWHGTIVTSIIAKYAPEARITVYRYIDADTQNDSPFPLIVTSLMGAAIYKAVHDGNDVINISAGTNIDAAYLREACQYAYDNNVIVVTASPYYLGRYLGGSENYPGQYPTTISVTGIEKRGENQYGPWDIAAPEVTTTVGSPNAPFVAFPTYVEEKDDYASGISCATPIVAALVALVESLYPRLGTEPPGGYFETVKRLLIENANPRILGFEGFSPEGGYGLIDAEKTVEAAAALQRERTVRPEKSSPAAGSPAAVSSGERDEVFLAGRKIFYQELRLALGSHPLRDRLLPSHLEKIRNAECQIPQLYENLVNITFLRQRPEFLELLEEGDITALAAKYGELCRQTAGWFIESLFEEGPRTQERLAEPSNLGRDRLDLVLSSAGMNSSRVTSTERIEGLARSVSVEKDWAFRITQFPGALRMTKGRGVRLAIIDSGFDPEIGSLKKANINHHFDFAVAGRTSAPWRGEMIPLRDALGRGTLLASVLASCAPEAEIRLYKISYPLQSPYEYWLAMQFAQAVYKAADDKNDVILTTAEFATDFAFVREACRSAYWRNVVLIAPNGAPAGQNHALPAFFPAHYGSTVAVAGVTAGRKDKPVLWDLSGPSHYTAVAAPAVLRPGDSPDPAVAVALPAGLVALIASRVPKTGKELNGQYVQRVMEILVKSADPQILGYQSFDPKAGYGLINAQKTVEQGIPSYLEKMTQVEEDFKKRMARRAEEEEKRQK